MATTTSLAFGLDRKLPPIDPRLKHYDFRIGEPRISPFPGEVLEKLQHKKNINVYYPSHGDHELRELIIKKYYGDHNLDNIAITHGTLGALDLIIRAFAGPLSEVLVPDPGFPPYQKLAEFSGASVRKYYLNLSHESDYCINWDHLESQITEFTRLVIINSPHNPTGKVLSVIDYLRFQKMLKNHPHVSFVMDEIYRELIYDEKVHFDFSRFINRGFVVGSFSKMYPLQGARVGWVLTSNEKMERLTPYFNNVAGPISSFGQEIAKIVLKREYSFKEHYVRAKSRAISVLESHHVEHITPEGAFFVFIKYAIEGTRACEELAERGVSVVPGIVFGQLGEYYVRASFAEEDKTIKEGFALIGKHWAKTHPRTIH